LLTTPTSLSAAAAAELARLRPQRIVVVGSAGAVSDAVLRALRPYATSGVVDRIGGRDRYATAAAVSAATFAPGAPVAYVATGLNFPDALAGGVAAAREGGPMLLALPTAIPAATAAELQRLRPGRIVLLGGPSVVSDGVLAGLRGHATSGVVTRLAGPDRYATAVAVSRATAGTDAPGTVFVATGLTFADGLAGTPAAARAGAPLLTVPSSTLPQVVADELRRLNAPTIVILGGTGAVSQALAAQISALWD
ncbi:MAG: cell wall-binding repeat-containing protein, partial [Chloroflexi bacterium]|nr:cell wall-binding repeat-containing protein [Chloroflexota bacterium]